MTEDDRMEEMMQHPLWEKFQAFAMDRPSIYNYAVQFAREYKAAGHKRIGIHVLIERVRWEIMVVKVTGQPAEEFKIPNGYKPLYGRLIAVLESDLADMFEFRELTSIR